MNEELINDLKKHNFKKNSIKQIALKHGYKESELKKIYTLAFFEKIAKYVNLHELAKSNIESIEKKIPQENIQEFNFIKTDLKHILQKSLYIAMNNGFALNINKIQNFKENWNIIKDICKNIE